MKRPFPDTRSELLGLLSEACEIEHALACAYLYAAFSVKTRTSEGLSWQAQQQNVRDAAEVYKIAAEEMSHLAQAWNLLAAIGGSPWLGRPGFPATSPLRPSRAIELSAWSVETLEAFHAFETPEPPRSEWTPSLGFSEHDHFEYGTVGELYDLVDHGLQTLPERELFVGVATAQADEALIDFPDIVVVRDRATARAAVNAIRFQGEGRRAHDQDCHHATFGRLLDTWRRLPGDEVASRVRPAARNPRRDGILNVRTRRLADLFDDAYLLMLLLLGFAFAQSDALAATRRRLARIAIVLMTTALKPLGEQLMLEPLVSTTAVTAGPCFQLGRVVALPANERVAFVLVSERLERMANSAERLQLARDGESLTDRIAEQFRRLAASLAQP